MFVAIMFLIPSLVFFVFFFITLKPRVE